MIKNIFLLYVFLLSNNFLFGQSKENRALESFSKIRSSEAINVYLKKGDKNTAEVQVDGIEINEVITEVKGETLRIHLDSDRYRRGNKEVDVYVTFSEILKELSASSASSIYSEGVLEGDEMDISTSSAGTIELKLKVNNLVVSTSSAGDIQLEGQTNKIQLSASSAGIVNAYDLEAEHADVRVNSAGSARIYVTKSLKADASSGGSLRYKGNPSSSHTNSSSGGSVKKTF